MSPRVTDQGQMQTLLSLLPPRGLLAGGKDQDTRLFLSACCVPGSFIRIGPLHPVGSIFPSSPFHRAAPRGSEGEVTQPSRVTTASECQREAMHSGVFGAISRLCSHLCPASPPGVSGTKIPQGQACPQAGCGLREGCGETVRAAFGGSPSP